MNLKQLESLVLIIETKSFSHAASKLFLTQPTISSHISLLEKELNANLLVRTTKEVYPTEDGKKLYTYAKQMLRLQNTILEVFNVRNKVSNDLLTLGASSIPEQYILPEVLPEYIKDNKIEFKILQGDSTSVIDKVLKKEVEIGLVGTKIDNISLVYQPFYKDKLVIITPFNDKYLKIKKNFHIKDLLKEPIIMREEGSGTRKETKEFLKIHKFDIDDLNVIATLNSTEAIKKSVQNNMGISIMSKLSVKDFEKDKKVLVFEFAEDHMYRNLYIVRNKETFISRSATKFIGFIKDFFDKEKVEK